MTNIGHSVVRAYNRMFFSLEAYKSILARVISGGLRITMSLVVLGQFDTNVINFVFM